MGGIVGVDVAMLNAHFCLCLACFSRLLENSWFFSHNVKRE